MTEVDQIRVKTLKFYEEYGYLPGDIPDASDIDSCKNKICNSGNGDGYIGEGISENHTFTGEEKAFWDTFYAHEHESGCGNFKFFPFYHDGKNPLPFTEINSEAGHYLAFLENNKLNENSFSLQSKAAAKIDRYADDGLPQSGRIIAAEKSPCFILNEEDKKIYDRESYKECTLLYFYFLRDEKSEN